MLEGGSERGKSGSSVTDCDGSAKVVRVHRSYLRLDEDLADARVRTGYDTDFHHVVRGSRGDVRERSGGGSGKEKFRPIGIRHGIEVVDGSVDGDEPVGVVGDVFGRHAYERMRSGFRVSLGECDGRAVSGGSVDVAKGTVRDGRAGGVSDADEHFLPDLERSGVSGLDIKAVVGIVPTHGSLRICRRGRGKYEVDFVESTYVRRIVDRHGGILNRSGSPVEAYYRVVARRYLRDLLRVKFVNRPLNGS